MSKKTNKLQFRVNLSGKSIVNLSQLMELKVYSMVVYTKASTKNIEIKNETERAELDE